MLRFDHIAIAAESLEAGVAWVEDLLGLRLAGGGKHPTFGTHNRLISLGDLYLEVIAIDPEAAPPGRPRWFDMDRFAGPPRITNWVCESDNLAADLARAPKGTGTPLALSRGDYRWRMAVPEDGRLPFDGAFPALIQWDGPHPAQALPDQGLRLQRLMIGHPQAEALAQALHLADDRVEIAHSPVKTMTAVFDTPFGQRSLG
ncbi:VOC family protein [Rhodobacter sp. KR11]|uniref:VOC family protein n=1 Tax=Rhodobacter sp. KR11 TaxID=2974588 RepID=UPI0022219B5A|nr:VOC family protein [Rhodobacter sp. KR11]MCW1920226.1 VOC family protein [Rhodobacter sp. KR11]